MLVYLHPNRKRIGEITNGVDLANWEMAKNLPQAGVLLTDDRDAADIVAAHINMPNHTPDIIHCHGLYPTGMGLGDAWAWDVNASVIHAARVAREVTVPSPWVGELFQRDMGFSPTVVPHGIDLEQWEERVIEEPLPVALWNKNRSIDVCNPEPVMELAKDVPDVHFLTTVGKASKNVEVTGILPWRKMQETIYRTGIYLATTKETFGIGTLEAMAAGCPVLAWRWGATPDLVEHGVQGYVANPYDYEDSIEGLRYILGNQTRLSVAARERAAEYTWSAVCERYAMVYQAAWQSKEAARLPKVSVVIPCYNYASWVLQAIRSVKAQTYSEWECIVVDDGSTDNSVAAIQEETRGDRRFTLIQQENQGVAAARNHGALRATGTHIVFLDADDAMLPNCLERFLQGFDSRDVGLCYGKLFMMDATGKRSPRPSQWPGRYDIRAQLAGENQVPSCNMMRRDVFLRTGGFRQRSSPAEDAELWTRIPLLGYRVKLISEEPVYLYRLHQDSLSEAVRTGKRPEPDWRYWLPGQAEGAHLPFAAQLPPSPKKSHPVIDYDLPLVSIIIPCGPGHEELLGDALESVAAQTDPRWECIVVDDTEDGDLAERGEFPYRLRFPWVRWTSPPVAHNVSVARNHGVSISRGPWLLFLDADDILEREFLAELLPRAEECFEGGEFYYTDWYLSTDRTEEREIHKARPWRVRELKRQALFAITFLHARAAFDHVGGFDPDVALWEDWDYALRLARAGYKGVRVPQPLFTYRHHTGLRREEGYQKRKELVAAFRSKYEAMVPGGNMG